MKYRLYQQSQCLYIRCGLFHLEEDQFFFSCQVFAFDPWTILIVSNALS